MFIFWCPPAYLDNQQVHQKIKGMIILFCWHTWFCESKVNWFHFLCYGSYFRNSLWSELIRSLYDIAFDYPFHRMLYIWLPIIRMYIHYSFFVKKGKLWQSLLVRCLLNLSGFVNFQVHCILTIILQSLSIWLQCLWCVYLLTHNIKN